MVGTANVSLTAAKISEVPVPLLPIQGQHKVDELMTLCDQLEAQQTAQTEAHERLVATLLDTLTQSADAAAFADNWSRIAEHFDLLFDTPESIDKLKQSVLQLAVQGKLVPQDPNDEPASKLLKEIEANKTRLLQQKLIKIGQITVDSKFINDEVEIPETWAWAKGAEILFITKLAGFEYTEHFDLKDYGEIPVVRAQNVRPLNLEIDNLKFIDRKTSELLERCALTKKALLVTFIGAGIGDVALFDKPERWHLAPNVAKMEPFIGCENKIDLRYLNYFLISPCGRSEIFKHIKSTAQPSISMGTIRDIDYLVPPLAEQHRIVAKVDELMAECDALAARLTAARELSSKLVAVVAGAAAA